MTSIKSLVDRGLEIRHQMKLLKKELDTIESKLQDHGLYHDQVELKDPDREGRRYLAKGTSLVVPVIFTADKLIGSFKHLSPKHTSLENAIGKALPAFFELTQVWENRYDDGKRFRLIAQETLGEKAPPFITACLARDKHGIPKSDIKIAWDDAEPARP